VAGRLRELAGRASPGGQASHLHPQAASHVERLAADGAGGPEDDEGSQRSSPSVS